MPLHPAAPEDLPGLVSAYAQSVQAVIDLGRACSEPDFAKETACPGWTVKDHISHVVGVESWLGGAALTRPRTPVYAGAPGPEGSVAESAVESRRGVLGVKVVYELETVLAQRLAYLQDPSLTLDSVIKGPAGPAPAGEVMRGRILDVWTHQQDIRQALARPGDLDSPGASVFLDLLFQELPRIVAQDAGIEPGNAVIFDVTGPVVGRAGVRVELDDEGRRVATSLFTGQPHDGQDEHRTSIILSTECITRRAAGRGGLEDVHYTVHGDEEIARRVLEALPIVA
jgi:uncharacterized protein (TIGR03083 family)